jgi:serine protease AprX
MVFRRLFALSALVSLIMISADAADTPLQYWVYFRDKGLSPVAVQQSLQTAAQNLTPHARARRIRNHVPLADQYDLPVASDYVDHVRATGVRIRTVSSWLNAVSMEATPAQVARIEQLSFVKSVEPFRLRKALRDPGPVRSPRALDELAYGPSYRQYEISNIPELHNRGLTGQGIIICFLDTGFELTHRAFHSLHVLAKYDFIHRDTTVGNVVGEDSAWQSSHGTGTLSVCGGYRDSVLIGPAYRASYLLAKTEWVPTETHVEEDYYVEALQWADSLGADITSSSLGYIGEFPNFWYTFDQLDGHTAPTTRGLEVAAAHGILCVTAAGNERLSDWGHIITPADADSILAVGAVDSTGEIAAFSSPGPTGDGRIKPDVCAQGTWVFWAQPDSFGADDMYGYAAGTSLATPIVAGAAALIMQGHPGWSAQQVRAAIKNTALQASFPNNDYGWGLMDAAAAADVFFADTTNNDTSAVTPSREPIPRSAVLISAYPNPVNGTVTFTLTLPMEGTGRLALYDILGREAYIWPESKWSVGEQRLALSTESLTTGIYFARFESGIGNATQKIVILK